MKRVTGIFIDHCFDLLTAIEIINECLVLHEAVSDSGYLIPELSPTVSIIARAEAFAARNLFTRSTRWSNRWHWFYPRYWSCWGYCVN